MTAIVVAVIGPGSEVASEQIAVAEEVGSRLAAAGATVVCGGLDGVMDAAARGATGAGGTVVGILPGSDRSQGNAHLSVAIATGMGEARNTIVVRSADAVVAIGGGYGTLSEIGFALKLGIPVVGLDTWQLSRDGMLDTGIVVVRDAAQAVSAALTAAQGIRDDGAG